MPLYCMCKAEVLEQKTNGDVPDSPVKAVLPMHAMQCIKTGMEQYLPGEHGPHRHFPNVDVFECLECGARIAKER